MKGLVEKLEKVTAIRERAREREVEGCLVFFFWICLVVKRG